VGIPYQNLINSYLTDCVSKRVEPKLQWGWKWAFKIIDTQEGQNV
jgi:hypothetical protein